MIHLFFEGFQGWHVHYWNLDLLGLFVVVVHCEIMFQAIPQFLIGIKICSYENWQSCAQCLLLKSVHGLPEHHQRMYVGLWINELVVFERPVFISFLAFHSVSFAALSCSRVHSSCDIGRRYSKWESRRLKLLFVYNYYWMVGYADFDISTFPVIKHFSKIALW